MSPTKPSNPRVLVISASVGAGHNQAARAVVESLSEARPELGIEIIDSMEYVAWPFRAYYAGGFALAMTHFPRLYGLGYRLFDLPRSGLRRSPAERVKLAWERAWVKRLREAVLQRQPELIIHTHFLAGPALSPLIQSGRLRSRQVMVVTDTYMHRWWHCEDVEQWFLPQESTLQQARRWGLPEDRLIVSGMPLRSKWHLPVDRDKVYRDWPLPRDKPIVLVSGGTEFTVGPVVRIARDIVRACPQACVAVLAGRNKKLLAQLSQEPDPSGRLLAFGFTDRMPELSEVASIMVTKPGGMTTAECLSKGLPMVFLRPVPGQEGQNAALFEREGAGIIASSPDQAVAAVQRLLSDRSELGRYSANARRLYKPGAHLVRDHVLDMLEF